MTRLAPMLDRLPPPLRADAQGLIGRVLGVIDTQLAAIDEDMDRVRRSRLLASAFDREDVAKLAALFDLVPAAWEPTGMLRARLTATVSARLAGAVTREALDGVVTRLLDGAQTVLGVRYAALTPGAGGRVFREPAAVRRPGQPVFREFPPRRRRDPALVAQGGRLRPLDRFTLTHRGLKPSLLEGVLRGWRGGRTAVPLLAHPASGRVVVFRGVVPCGVELRLEASGETLRATLDGREATERLITAGGFVPGAAVPLTPDAAPKPIVLSPGENLLWFVPLALYDERVLDRGALAMPGLEVRHGVFGGTEAPGTNFDDSLFEQPPSVAADLFWEEAVPASFRFEVPGGAVRREAAETGDAAALRVALLALLNDTLRMLRAAGVDGRAEFAPLRETQRQRDRGRAVNPFLPPDTQITESRMAGVTALFDETAREGARFA
ncbi:hypothetical protein LPC08_12695 [Roseomonas sp. OT10]|uniref:hypothetical protein n=1 Tax=Roseomonas cutis TaxID=2897332 RepID=UPI001E4B0D4E|nr:hypothetical protein [Roseomonas sp. OT10]UFN46888.1 hypothetical protein LPC08_12695 [Roseomonas sp. OT10]